MYGNYGRILVTMLVTICLSYEEIKFTLCFLQSFASFKLFAFESRSVVIHSHHKNSRFQICVKINTNLCVIQEHAPHCSGHDMAAKLIKVKKDGPNKVAVALNGPQWGCSY